MNYQNLKNLKNLIIVVTIVALALVSMIRASAMTMPAVYQPEQPPSLLTYQGHLLDAAGEPVPNGAYQMEFSLWNGPTGGNRLWGPEAHDVEVEDGFFAVTLGDEQPIDASVLQTNTYVEIAVGGETLIPRQQLAAVAFALSASETQHAVQADAAPWAGLTNVPAGFADNVDNDTIYTDTDTLDAVQAAGYVTATGVVEVISNTEMITVSVTHATTATYATTSTVATTATYATDADLLDGQDGSYYRDAGNINAGTLGTGYYSALADLVSEGYLDNNADTDLLTRAQADERFVNTGEANSITSAMIADGASLAEILDDDGAGSGLDADLLDGQSGAYYRNWNNLTNVPAGFADGVDDDTTYSAGTGLNLVGTTFSLDTTYTDGHYWRIGGNSMSSTGILGTTSEEPLDIRVNNVRALRLEQFEGSGTPNVIGGYSGNAIEGKGSVIGGGGRSGSVNLVFDEYSVIAGGRGNEIWEGDYGDYNDGGGNIGGGISNLIDGPIWAVVGGGENNSIFTMNVDRATEDELGKDSTIGGGYGNTIDASWSTIGGGQENTIDSAWVTIGGGRSNTAGSTFCSDINCTLTGNYATVPGGRDNTAAGSYSFAAGRRAKANNQGCFVWGDSTDANVTCNNDNRWVARASGGVYFYTNSSLTSGSYLSAGGGSWNAVSNRDLKENFAPVDEQELLARLAGIEISTWNYKAQDPSIRHVGPMAQDFNALLPDLGGEGEKYINSLDANGVALAAAQGLYEISQEQAARIEELEQENAGLQQQLDDLEARVEMLEQGSVSARSEAQGETLKQGSVFARSNLSILPMLGLTIGLVLFEIKSYPGRRQR